MSAWFGKWTEAWMRKEGRSKEPVAFGLTFPTHKPAAKVTIDDRGILFMGVWPSVELLRNFQPWNKGGK